MRAVAISLLVLACLLAIPYASADVTLPGKTVPLWVPYAPQVFCVTVHDATGSARCDVQGEAGGVSVVRVQPTGTVRVRVHVVDEAAGVQLAYLDCTSACGAQLTRVTTTTQLRLVVITDAIGPGASATVTLEARV